ncbi:MAG: M48 family metallopeptidase [Candidatus Omnitrophica bacterium]|nr:M48 family metallopeptidase [Candidatus Omnitrophota bacterium]
MFSYGKINHSQSIRFFLIVLLTGCYAGCAYINPFIENIDMVSLSQEKQLSQQISTEVSKTKTIVNDPAKVDLVRRIGNRLVAALPRKDFDYQFYVVSDNTPNAFTIPGGIVYVHTGLLDFVDDESELAGVIGHEIGHAYDRHPTKTLTRAYGVTYLTNLLFKNDPNQFRKITLQLAAGGILTKYSRDEEREADDIGFYLLKKAGYPSDGLLRFFRKLDRAAGKQTIPAFLSDHPATQERIARLEALEKNPVPAG